MFIVLSGVTVGSHMRIDIAGPIRVLLSLDMMILPFWILQSQINRMK